MWGGLPVLFVRSFYCMFMLIVVCIGKQGMKGSTGTATRYFFNPIPPPGIVVGAVHLVLVWTSGHSSRFSAAAATADN